MDVQEAARARGVDVSCDTTSYIAGLGLMAAVLPPWLFDEGPAIAAERLGDPVIRQRVKGDLNRYWLMVARGEWDILWLGRTSNSMHHFGKSFIDIADAVRKQPLDAYLDIFSSIRSGARGEFFFWSVPLRFKII